MHDGETKPASMGSAQAHSNAPAHARTHNAYALRVWKVKKMNENLFRAWMSIKILRFVELFFTGNFGHQVCACGHLDRRLSLCGYRIDWEAIENCQCAGVYTKTSLEPLTEIYWSLSILFSVGSNYFYYLVFLSHHNISSCSMWKIGVQRNEALFTPYPII